MEAKPNYFADIVDNFDAAATAPASAPAADYLSVASEAASNGRQMIQCPNCRGSGRFSFRNGNSGECFKCSGTGRATAPRPLLQDAAHVSARAHGKVQREAQRAKDNLEVAASIETYKATHPAVWTWLCENSMPGRYAREFAMSLLMSLARNGDLTENQTAAVERSIAKTTERKAARVAEAPVVTGSGFDKLLAGFQRASGKGLKHPTLRCAEIVFTFAPRTSKNPNFIYVKIGGNYKGKISPEGKFFGAYGTTPAETQAITKIGRDPLAAAISHGRLTGRCAICSHMLVDPVSVERGIGPICAGNFGF